MAQPGTRARWIALCFALAGCTQVTTVAPDAGSNDAGASPGSECHVASDCALVYRGCCGSCLPAAREELLAVPKSKQAEAQREQCANPPACGACNVADPQPLASLMAADCVANRCELVDLRASEISSCKADSDCVAVGRGCCPPYSADPAGYVGIHAGADTAILECSPAPPCAPPQPHATPIAFCAADGHCAVRRNETLKGKPSSSCYSPTQNLEHAYDDGALGCDCAPGSMSMCPHDATGRGVALECGDQWLAVEDGACYL